MCTPRGGLTDGVDLPAVVGIPPLLRTIIREPWNLKPPLPEDRPDIAPSWASDQLLAIEAVVRSFPLGSAAGTSGLRPQHMLDFLNSADSAAKAGLLEALLTMVTATSSGRLHPRAAPYLCAARLIQLRKKDSGVLPIAVVKTLRRLVAKWLLASS